MIDEAMMLRECIYNLSGQDPQETKAVMQAAASKIDELRAENERLTLGWNAANVDVLHHAMTIDAQRKVLEQALWALQYNNNYVNKKQALEAITAIQEQLK